MAKQFHLLSGRRFMFSFFEHDNCDFSDSPISLDEIINNKQDYESFNAMQENIDVILDLKCGEVIQMKFNRDNPDSDGIIKRVK